MDSWAPGGEPSGQGERSARSERNGPRQRPSLAPALFPCPSPALFPSLSPALCWLRSGGGDGRLGEVCARWGWWPWAGRGGPLAGLPTRVPAEVCCGGY